MPRIPLIEGFLSPSIRWLARGLAALAFLAGTGASWAAAGQTITSIQQYWDLTSAEKAQPQEFELACTVTFFDPEWRILFVQDASGQGAYVPYGNNPYPFKAGEGILARGRFLPPGLDISFEHATVTPRSAPAVSPVEATGGVSQPRRFDNRYVAMEGFVDRIRRSDEKHLQLNMSVNGESVFAWVLMEPKALTPDLADRRVRLEGVYNPKIAPDGMLTSLEVMVPSPAKITPLARLEEEPGFQLPVSPINTLPDLPPDRQVHVMGTVVAREPGRFVRIRDTGGQVDLMTGQMRPLVIGEVVEAIGHPAVNGLEWRLEGAIFREHARPATAKSATGTSAPIELANEVMRLSADEAARARPVQLTGVVTWSNAKAPFFFMNDSSGGVCVLRGNSTSPVRSPGRMITVQGVTGIGAFAPVVIASSFDRIGEAIVPVARHVSLEHAMTGIEEAQWVEMRGYLREITRNGEWNELKIATATTDFTAVLPAVEDVSAMVGSVIRLHGACTAEADSRRKLTGIKLWVPGAAYVQVEEPAPVDPFALPERPLASLGQFETVQAFNRRVRVSGVVLRHLPGHSINLADGDHSLLIQTKERAPVRPGDRLEAVGFLGRQGGRITLSEVVYRVIGHGVEPPARFLEPQDAPEAWLDGQLVRINGVLLGGAVVGRFTQFTIQTPRKIFEATLELTSEDFVLPESGSRVALTGVYAVGYDERSQADTFALRLRTPADLVVLETPSWWTRTRILAFTGVLALGALLFIGWITILRRQVQRQTDQIRQQVERESRLQSELARAGKLESLGLLAGGIAHDFNNLLTVLIGNMSLVRLDAKLSGDSARSLAQAEKAAARARDLTQQLLTFAKGGAPLRAAVSLPEVVREVAEFGLRGSKVGCEFDLPADLWPANVDKGQIGQVVQNIVLNALQAMPEGGVLKIALSNHKVGGELAGVLAPGRYVRLDFIDQGPGIPPADLVRVFDPYFTTKQKGSGLGLATVHSIVKKHGGHVTAESTPGHGTTFRIWLPAAEAGSPVKTETVPPIPPPVAAATSRTSRVLLLDDESFIQDLACSILRRYGYEPTAVADGQAAINEYTRARAAGQPYDLVILDLTIPGGMGGRQTMEELLKIDPAVKAIVSSGYSNDLVLSNYQAHGFRGMVSKPYDVADFAHTVARVLKGERA
jgi:signal transduction histidine kinase/CheY-like chemotaxis protein